MGKVKIQERKAVQKKLEKARKDAQVLYELMINIEESFGKLIKNDIADIIDSLPEDFSFGAVECAPADGEKHHLMNAVMVEICERYNWCLVISSNIHQFVVKFKKDSETGFPVYGSREELSSEEWHEYLDHIYNALEISLEKRLALF